MLGNHDCLGDEDAQIEVKKRHPTWDMPSKYYSHSYDIDPDREGDELAILFANTCMLTCYSEMRSVFCNGAKYIPSDEEIDEHYQWN